MPGKFHFPCKIKCRDLYGISASTIQEAVVSDSTGVFHRLPLDSGSEIQNENQVEKALDFQGFFQTDLSDFVVARRHPHGNTIRGQLVGESLFCYQFAADNLRTCIDPSEYSHIFQEYFYVR